MPKPTLEQVKSLISRHPMGPEGFAPLLTGNNPDGSRYELTIEQFGDNELAFDSPGIAFAAGAPINTPVEADLPPPDRLDPAARYLVIVHNPGAVAVTVRLFNREFLSGSDRLSPVATVNVPAGGVAVQSLVQGLYVGSGASLVRVTNDALVPAGGGFSVDVRVRRP